MVTVQNKSAERKYKVSFICFLAFFSLMFTNDLNAQNYLEVPVKVEIENGNVDDLMIKVMKGGKPAFTQSAVSKMKLKLNYNSNYTIIFSKDGYVTKSIEFDTKAPADHIKDGFDPYKIGVKLFKQYDGVNVTVYNQPVGKIRFNKELDEFNFDTDYSKSILSKLQDTEEKLIAKAVEEKRTGEPAAVVESEPPVVKSNIEQITPEPINKTEENSITDSNTSEKQLSKSVNINQDLPPRTKHNSGNDVNNKLLVNGGNENKGLLAMDASNDIGSSILINTGADAVSANNKMEGNDHPRAPNKMNDGNDNIVKKLSSANGLNTPSEHLYNDEMERITREDIVEKNRIITLVKVTKGKTTTEYRRVHYHWGGPFYFINSAKSVSENVFVFATGIKD